jgi:hypothetical protein
MIRTPHQRGGGSRIRRRGIVGGSLAAAAVLIATVTGFGAANAATGATVYEQAAYNQSVSIAASNTHTIVSSSPVLPEGAYQVNSVISFNNLTPGSQVLCGWTTTASDDGLYGNYGDAENQAATASTGSCTVTGTAQINSGNDQLELWATVYSGPAGPVAYSWSANETPVAGAVVSSLT